MKSSESQGRRLLAQAVDIHEHKQDFIGALHLHIDAREAFRTEEDLLGVSETCICACTDEVKRKSIFKRKIVC